MITRLKNAVAIREESWNRRILKKELAQAAGVSSAAVTNWWKNETTELEARCVFGLSKFLSISPEWLQSGKGGMFAEPDNHISAPADIPKKSHLAGMIRESIPNTGPRMSEEPGERFDKNVTPADRRRIPVISYVQAGMMTEVVDPFALGGGLETVEAPIGCSERTFGLRIEGNSMEPRFHEGDVVIIDPALAPRPGDFVVGKNGKEEATFKKYRPRGIDENGDEVFELAPLNEDYATLHSKRDGLVIIGVCVGRWEVFREM